MPGDEARVSNVCWCSWSNIASVAMWLGSLYCHYSGIAATAVCNKVSKQLEAA